jgi:hypothetical protein
VNTEGSKQPPAPAPIPAARDNTIGSGEGASTALEALIRKRKQAETPEDRQPPAPLQR